MCVMPSQYKWLFCLYFTTRLVTAAFGGGDNKVATQTFELREWFGVNHPEQVVEFTLRKVSNSNGNDFG